MFNIWDNIEVESNTSLKWDPLFNIHILMSSAFDSQRCMAMKSLLMIFSLLIPASAAATTYYVSGTSCGSYYPCLNIEDLGYELRQIQGGQSLFQTIHIVFMQADYYVNTSVRISLPELYGVIFRPLESDNPVNIFCRKDFSIFYTAINEFAMESLRFYGCSKSSPILKVEATSLFVSRMVIIEKVSFYNGNWGFINISGSISRLNVSDSSFHGNNNLGIYIVRADYVWFQNSNFSNHAGTAIRLGVLESVTFSNCKFFNNTSGNRTFGSAVDIFLTETICIENCLFMYNKVGPALFVYRDTVGYDHNIIMLTNCSFSYNSVRYGGIFTSVGNVSVLIQSCHFIHNSGGQGSALNISCALQVLVENSTFAHNTGKRSGAALIFETNITKINDSSFFDNSAACGGAVYLEKSDQCIVNDCIFINNKAEDEGGALIVSNLCLHNQKRFYVNIQDSTFTNNTVKSKHGRGGAISVYTVPELRIDSSHFIMNTAATGGSIYLKNARVFLVDNAFVKNRASSKGSVMFLSESKMLFDNISRFIDNLRSASVGEIFINESQTDCKKDECLLSWTNQTKLEFSNDRSMGDFPTIFGGMIDRCYRSQDDLVRAVSNSFSLNANKFKPTTTTGFIGSNTISFCFCNGPALFCDSRKIHVQAAPGQMIHVGVICVDQLRQPKPCTVRSESESARGESIKKIAHCEQLTYTVVRKYQNVSLIRFSGRIFCKNDNWNTLEVHINIEECPVGFQLSDHQCQCDSRISGQLNQPNCDINTNLIEIHSGGWFSYSGGLLRVHKTCPFNYCSLNRSGIHPSFPDAQCRHQHSGILCGGCVSNSSIILGSWKCRACYDSAKYSYIWLTLLMALAGIVLVIFLFLLKTTVSSGTTNGLIFYANILSFSGLLDHPLCSIPAPLRVFLSWINLDFGIEVCFYSGMDVYQKTWLQFVFPFYIWLLVGVILAVCHHSPTIMKLMGRRNIEVLATLFLLSYSKLLKTILTSLSFTDVMIARADDTSDELQPHRVWFYDGNVDFLGDDHLQLFIVSLVFLTFLFLPYTLLLLLGQLMRFIPNKRLGFLQSSSVTSILDAYHAPYTKHHRYWTGLGLSIRCLLFSLFAVSVNVRTNLLWITLAVTIIFLIKNISKTSVYRKKIASWFEDVCLVNLGILSSVLLYNGSYCFILTVSCSVSFLIFVLLISYHFHLELRRNEVYRWCVKKAKNVFFKMSRHHLSSTAATSQTEGSKISTTFLELRESLLDN